MSRVLPFELRSRRTILLLLAIGAALLVAAGLLVQPPARDVSGGSSSDAPHAATAADPGSASIDAASDAAVLATPESTAAKAATESFAPTDLRADRAIGGAGGASAVAPTDEVSADGIVAPSGGLDAPALEAKIIRTAAIELRVKRGHFERTWGDAQAVARVSGGYIASASRSGASHDTRLGTITMRVPSAKFDSAVERLRELGATKVERLDISSEDVTQEFVDTKSRLRHDRAVEARLLALLAETEGVSEVLAVQARLDQVQEQIEISRGRLQYLEKLTAYSTINVSLRAPASAREDAGDDHGSVLGDAWSDARERFAENVAAAIVWIGGALPTLLVLAALVIVARIGWRRHAARSAAPTTPESHL